MACKHAGCQVLTRHAWLESSRRQNPRGQDTFVSGRGAAPVLRLPSRQHSPPLSEGPAGSQCGPSEGTVGQWTGDTVFSKFYSLSSLSHSTRNIPLLFPFSLVSLLPHLISAAFLWCCCLHSVWQPFAVQLGSVIVSPCGTDSEVALAKPGVLGLFQKDHRDLPGNGGILQAWPRDRAARLPCGGRLPAAHCLVMPSACFGTAWQGSPGICLPLTLRSHQLFLQEAS